MSNCTTDLTSSDHLRGFESCDLQLHDADLVALELKIAMYLTIADFVFDVQRFNRSRAEMSVAMLSVTVG